MGLTALPIRIGESVEGYLVARPAEDDDALTQVALEQASTVFALELAKLRSAEHETEKSRGDLLDQLLASPLRNVPTLVRWAARLGLDLEAPCTVIAFDLSRVVEAEPGREWQRSRFLRICLAVLERRGVRRIAAWRNDRLVAVVGATPEMARDAASAVVAEVAAMSGGGPLAGVGGSVSSPAEVARSHEEALRALETARRVKRLGPVAGAGALDFHQLLLGASPRTDQDDLARAFLAPLETAGGQLPQTVAAYLEAGGNIERTAHLLSVHPNTVRNRVQRISELLGRDLTQADTRLDLHLALKVLGLDFR
jgi:sugar diacid utilization regulator